jgi:RNA polymerase sigma-70 factor (ECF subfamily)
MRIVVNAALLRRRKESPQATAAPEQAIHEEDQPEAMAQRDELRRRLEKEIGALPPIYRAVFMLRAVELRSVRETADELRIPEPTVRTRFFRARERLRRALSEPRLRRQTRRDSGRCGPARP